MTSARQWTRAIVGGAVVLITALPAAQSTPSRWALVVGVGTYASPSIHHLDGPPLDAAAVARELTTRWGFPSVNVRILTDAQATRANILNGLDWLIEQTRPGDQVVIFYSGHGTSRQDRNQLHYDLHPGTGAIFPYDVATDSEARAMETLLIGRRDLRPRLEQLDRGRNVFVILDACYSENASRGGDAFARRPVGQKKAEPLFGELQSFVAPADREPYPYQNVVSLSAAAEGEQAMDVSADDIRNGVHTIDDRPKGALTDALLRALRGDANTNNDRAVSLDELFQFVRQDVTTRFRHTPQLQIPDSRLGLRSMPLFGVSNAPSRAVASAAGPLRVRADGLPAALTARLQAIPGVTMVTSDQDLTLTVRNAEVGFMHRSGDFLEAVPLGNSSTYDAIVTRVARQARANELLGLTLPFQDFNVRVDIPSQTGVLRGRLTGKSDPYTLIGESDAAASILILNIDKEGFVSILYPSARGDLRAETKWSIGDIQVTKPDGTEFLKVFAFRSAPSWLPTAETFGVQPAGSARVDELLRNLRQVRQGAAETRLKIVTVVS